MEIIIKCGICGEDMSFNVGNFNLYRVEFIAKCNNCIGIREDLEKDIRGWEQAVCEEN
jgi:hypothetical protein